MKYGLQYGYGDYIYEGRQVAVVEFANGNSLSAWLRESSSNREEVSKKAYVTSMNSGRSVFVTKAAVSPDHPMFQGFRGSGRRVLLPEEQPEQRRNGR